MAFDLLALTTSNLTSKALLQECVSECIYAFDFLMGIVLSWPFFAVFLRDNYFLMEMLLVLVEGVQWLLWGWYRFVQRGVFAGVFT